VVASDFLEYQGHYDKIVMNPPFQQQADIDHVRHAYSLLNAGGRLVAIVSEGVFFRQDKKASAFREWLEEVGGTSEQIEAGAFDTSDRPTGVATRLVVVDAPLARVEPAPPVVVPEVLPDRAVIEQAEAVEQLVMF
jgi:hypothetical protein